ncbi:MAG: hypothetical protein J6M95_00160 [Bacilli bacterium]|nr:hypothetical protein [Bacilli bacterium]
MKKKFLSLAVISLFSLVLGACSSAASSPSGSGEGGGGSDDKVVADVFANLAKSPLSLTAQRTLTMQYGEDEPYVQDNGVLTVLLSQNYFFKSQEMWGGVVTARYDRATDGSVVIYQLNPLTNAVDSIPVTDYATRQPVPFDAAFGNPFNNAFASGFMNDSENNRLLLLDPAGLNANYFFNVVMGGEQIGYPLMDFEIGYDENYKPTNIYVMFGQETEWNTTYYEFDGEFIDASEVNVNPVPTPRAVQPGQDKLKSFFDRLHNMNYTVDWNCHMELGEDYGYEEPYIEDSSLTTYLTPTGYYHDIVGTVNGRTSQGEIETPEGLVSFEKTDTGYVATKTPRQIRTVENVFGNFWTYSPQSFDVNEDGSFTLANIEGFANYLWLNLITDGTIYGPTSPTNIKITLDEVNDTLTYVYGNDDGSITCRGVVKNIGTTVLPLSISDIAPCTPITTWQGWYEANQRWAQNTMDALNLLTGNHPEAIPYLYTPYDYERSMNTKGESEFVMEPYPHIEETLEDVQFIKTTHQFDTCNEAVKAFNDAIKQADEGGFFTYDAQKDVYVYKTETIHLTMKIYIVKDFVGVIADEIFNYGVVVDVRNENWVPEDNPIIFD